MNAALCFYNEIDAFAADWLEQLIADGAIPAGIVDRRDIRDLRPSDLDGFEQCLFFAGIGGWAEVLRLSGREGMRGVWTGSCPCQPFSAAGKALGFADERHLWPAFFHLIDRCRPDVVMGEQVASKDGLAWLDLVYDDLEGAGYAVRSTDCCAAGIGAPHVRQRLWFVADAAESRRSEQPERDARAHRRPATQPRRLCDAGAMAFAEDARLKGRDKDRRRAGSALPSSEGARALGDTASVAGRLSERVERACAEIVGAGEADRLGDAGREGRRQIGEIAGGCVEGSGAQELVERPLHECARGHWSDLEWLACRDGKARPTQPGLQPLAHGVSNRVGTLRGAGNAIVPQAGAEVIRAMLDQSLLEAAE